MSSVRVLFLAANPRSTSRLALDEEMHAIQQRLRESGAAERFDLRSEWALRADALPAALMRHMPSIVHFSGHGTVTGALLLVGTQSDQVAPVAPETLQRLFKTLGNDLFCVVLNACFSEELAKSLIQIVPCAVGMARQVADAAAISFAAGFYEALAFDRSIQVAFELGCTAIELAQQTDQRLVPQLRHRPNVDPEKLRLFSTELPRTSIASNIEEAAPKLRSSESSLVFHLDREANFTDDANGLSLAFTLINVSNETIVVHSIRIHLLSFTECSAATAQDGSGSLQLSSPRCRLVASGAEISFEPLKNQVAVSWAGDLPVYDDGIEDVKLRGQLEKLREIAHAGQRYRSLTVGRECELLMERQRFQQRAGDADSFFFQFTGADNGHYHFQLAIGYHCGRRTYELQPDKIFTFAKIR